MTFYKFARAVVFIIYRTLYRFEVEGTENIPKDGKGIICGNHYSMLDPVFIGISVKRDISFMTKKEIFKSKFLKFLFTKMGTFPVERNTADFSAVKNSLKVLKQGKLLGIFPEGTRVKEKNVQNVKAGIGMICIKGKSPIIPVYVDTNYKAFSKVHIKIGKPLDFSDYYGKKLGSEDYKKISKEILEKIYELKI